MRIAGCALGALLAISMLFFSRPAGGGGELGAEVTVTAGPTGELGVIPAAPTPLLSDRAMRPGDAPVSGTFELRNQTGETLSVRFGALTTAHELDDSLLVELRSGDTLLRGGPVGALRQPDGEPLLLGPGAATPVTITASLQAGATGWEAALAEVGIQFDVVMGAP